MSQSAACRCDRKWHFYLSHIHIKKHHVSDLKYNIIGGLSHSIVYKIDFVYRVWTFLNICVKLSFYGAG